MPHVPDRAQSLAALRKGDAFRRQRAALKREVKAGQVSVATLLREPIPDWLANMHVEQLVLSLRRFQRRRFLTIMAEAEAGPAKRLGELTARQRNVIAAEIDTWESERGIPAEAAA